MKFYALSALVASSAAYSQLQNLESDPYYASSSYQSQTASAKSDQLWSQIIADTTSGHFPGLKLPGLFLESMAPTFETNADAMPMDGLFGARRTKYIHSVGVVGKCSFVSNGSHPYTGGFEGTEHAFCRLSSAAQPSDLLPLVPALSVKFLKDGVKAGTTVSSAGVNGQPGDWNFFLNDFSNHIGAATGVALDATADYFAHYTDYIQETGLSGISESGQDGKTASPNVFPFQLRFHPHASVQNLIPNDFQGYMAYTHQLETSVPADATIYDVYAYDKPPALGGVETLIGSLKLNGSLTTSLWGDQNLFFQHQNISEDLKLMPSWKPYVDLHSLGGKCPYQTMLQNLNLW